LRVLQVNCSAVIEISPLVHDRERKKQKTGMCADDREECGGVGIRSLGKHPIKDF
jgi:hypothetical protein